MSDLPAMARLLASCAETPPWPAGAWRTGLGGPELEDEGDHKSVGELPWGSAVPVRRRSFGAFSEARELVGMLVATCFGQETEVEWIVVAPAARRLGLARAMVEAWLAWAVTMEAHEALLEVRASNAAARGLYGSLGFTEQGVRRGYYCAPVEDAVLMHKALGAYSALGSGAETESEGVEA